jgi:hypothetical protein
MSWGEAAQRQSARFVCIYSRSSLATGAAVLTAPTPPKLPKNRYEQKYLDFSRMSGYPQPMIVKAGRMAKARVKASGQPLFRLFVCGPCHVLPEAEMFEGREKVGSRKKMQVNPLKTNNRTKLSRPKQEKSCAKEVLSP